MQENTNTQKSNQPEFGRVSEIAEKLRVSTNTVWRLARESKKTKFPLPIKLSEKVTVWRWSEIHSWIASKEQAAQ